jgi:hypothetical protein
MGDRIPPESAIECCRNERSDASGIRNRPIAEQGRWRASVVRGHYAYYGVLSNSHALEALRIGIVKKGHRSLRRRGQRRTINVGPRWLANSAISRSFHSTSACPRPRALRSRARPCRLR